MEHTASKFGAVFYIVKSKKPKYYAILVQLMTDTLFQSIIELVQSLGYMGVFYGALLEEFFYIVPSSLVQLSAGAILLGELQLS